MKKRVEEEVEVEGGDAETNIRERKSSRVEGRAQTSVAAEVCPGHCRSVR